jgi:hypothetical protein
VAQGDTVNCYIVSVKYSESISTYGQASAPGPQTISISAAPYLDTGDQLELVCTSNLQTVNSQNLSSGFTMMLVGTSNNNTADVKKGN